MDASYAPRQPTVLALGSPHGDDQIAWRVVELLRQSSFSGTCVRLATPWDVMPFLQGQGPVIIMDACRSGAPAGTIFRMAVQALPDFRGTSASTHGGSLAGVLKLAESLGYDTSMVVIFAVEAESCQPGAPLSESAHRAAEQLAQRIRLELTEERYSV